MKDTKMRPDSDRGQPTRLRFLIYLALCSFTISAAPQANSKIQSLHVLPAEPSCLPREKPDQGANLYLIPENSFCSSVDMERNTPHFLAKFLETWLSNRKIVEIRVGFFAFSSPDVNNVICNNLTSQSIVQVVVYDENLADANSFEKCANTVLATSFTAQSRGGVGEHGVFHIKIMVVKTDDGNALTLVGSANPTFQSNMNHDYYIAVAESGDTPFYELHRCWLDSVFQVPDGGDTTAKMAGRYQACKQKTRLPVDFPLQPFLLPFDNDKFLPVLGFLMGNADKIGIAMEAMGWSPLCDLLLTAKQRNIEVSVTRDDDTWYFMKLPALRGLRDYWSDVDDASCTDRLIGGNVEVNFVATNHYDNPRNFLHAKLMIFFRSGVPTASIVGAANLTWAAFHANLENVYVMTDSDANKEIRDFLDRLATLATPAAQMPTSDASPSVRSSPPLELGK